MPVSLDTAVKTALWAVQVDGGCP